MQKITKMSELAHTLDVNEHMKPIMYLLLGRASSSHLHMVDRIDQLLGQLRVLQ